MFGAFGKALSKTCATFVSKASIENGTITSYGLKKIILPVHGCRNISKRDLIHNDKTPEITVNPENYEVRVDGKKITCEPAKELPLAQRYFLF
jgi:urease subunit alpha